MCICLVLCCIIIMLYMDMDTQNTARNIKSNISGCNYTSVPSNKLRRAFQKRRSYVLCTYTYVCISLVEWRVWVWPRLLEAWQGSFQFRIPTLDPGCSEIPYFIPHWATYFEITTAMIIKMADERKTPTAAMVNPSIQKVKKTTWVHRRPVLSTR